MQSALLTLIALFYWTPPYRYNTGVTISVAVSNVCNNKMGSPEIAFNALAVGAFGDNNTTMFSDDIPACTGAVNFSAYKNPNSPNNDREEPDIVAQRALQLPTSLAVSVS